jgi:hypothetical protein
MPLVYGELRQLAAAYLRGGRQGRTLQPTALVDAACLRLVDQSTPRLAKSLAAWDCTFSKKRALILHSMFSSNSSRATSPNVHGGSA